MGRWRWLGTLGETVCASACRRRGFHPTIHARHRANRRLAPKRGETLWWGIDVATLAPRPVSLVPGTPTSCPATRFRDDLRLPNRMEKESNNNAVKRRVPFPSFDVYTREREREREKLREIRGRIDSRYSRRIRNSRYEIDEM